MGSDLNIENKKNGSGKSQAPNDERMAPQAAKVSGEGG
jgi:hypothetical protein